MAPQRRSGGGWPTARRARRRPWRPVAARTTVIRATRPTSATLEASVWRWNIDSPANRPPIATPYSPPASCPRRPTPPRCAPSPARAACGRPADVAVDPRPGPAAVGARRDDRIEGGVDPDLEAAARLAAATGSPGALRLQRTIPRGSGDHQAIGPPPGRHRKKPGPVGSQQRPGSRSAPTPTTSPAPAASARARPGRWETPSGSLAGSDRPSRAGTLALRVLGPRPPPRQSELPTPRLPAVTPA